MAIISICYITQDLYNMYYNQNILDPTKCCKKIYSLGFAKIIKVLTLATLAGTLAVKVAPFDLVHGGSWVQHYVICIGK